MSLDFNIFEKKFVSRRVLTLAPFLDFLKEIGTPHHLLPPTIHVAGTNGKGSTIAMLRAIYEAQGYKVHVITSPHLYDVIERLVLGSQQVSQQALLMVFKKYEALALRYQLSWYELMIGVSLKLCAQVPADVLLLETGLGGEFDATNVIEAPALSIITPISLDHHEFLGGDLTGVAHAKAGIIKKNCSVLSAPQVPEVQAILQAKALEQSAFFQTVSLDGELPQPNLHGNHQRENAAVAVQAVGLLKQILPVTEQAVAQGLQAIKWPGRLESLGTKKGCPIWFDVAHNPAAAEAIGGFFTKRPGPKILLFALLKNKNALETMQPLLGVFDEVIFFEATEPERYHSPKDLQEIAQDLGKESTVALNFQAALEEALQGQKKEILIAGSHYMAEDIKKTCL